MREQHGDRLFAVKGHAPRDHLIEADAERVEVAARVGRFSLRVFRRNIVHGTHGFLRECLGRGRAGNAEVRELHLTVARNNHVLRLHIAVHNALPVHFAEAVCDLNRNADGLLLFELALLADVLLQRDAVHKLHDNVVDAVRVLDLVDIDEIRMIDFGGCQRFLRKAANKVLVAVIFLLQDFDGDCALQFVTESAIHFRHAAGADYGLNLIAILQIGT